VYRLSHQEQVKTNENRSGLLTQEIKTMMRQAYLLPEYVQEAIGRLDNVWTPKEKQG